MKNGFTHKVLSILLMIISGAVFLLAILQLMGVTGNVVPIQIALVGIMMILQGVIYRTIRRSVSVSSFIAAGISLISLVFYFI